MKLSVRTTLALLALVALCWAPGAAHAQGVTTGSITGVVLDAQKRPCPARASWPYTCRRAPATRPSRREDGRFSIPGMRVGGPYTVTATPRRLQGRRRQGHRGQPRHRDTTWCSRSARRPLAEEVTVTAESTEVFTSTRTGAATAVTREMPRTLPTISGRHHRHHARLTPQYSAARSAHRSRAGQPREQHHGGRLLLQQLVRPRRPTGGPATARASRRSRSTAIEQVQVQRRAVRRAAGQLRRRRREHRHAQRRRTSSTASFYHRSRNESASARTRRAGRSTPARSTHAHRRLGSAVRSSRTSCSSSATTRTRKTRAR